MLRYQSNKKALVIAALIILLCLASLTGATLAIFTNNLNDGTIGIVTTAGNIKVAIVDAETGESLNGKALTFKNETILFEPGATFRTNGFKVKNIGDIDIQFRMSVSEDERLDMVEFSKAFEIWISNDPDNHAAGVPIHTFLEKLKPGQESSDTYFLYIKMKETAGNEFQNQEYDGIGVTIYAVQGNATN